MIHVVTKDTTIFQLDELLDDTREPRRPLAKVLGVDLCPKLKFPWLHTREYHGLSSAALGVL